MQPSVRPRRERMPSMRRGWPSSARNAATAVSRRHRSASSSNLVTARSVSIAPLRLPQRPPPSAPMMAPSARPRGARSAARSSPKCGCWSLVFSAATSATSAWPRRSASSRTMACRVSLHRLHVARSSQRVRHLPRPRCGSANYRRQRGARPGGVDRDRASGLMPPRSTISQRIRNGDSDKR